MDHSLDLIDQKNKIFECTKCKKRGKYADFYMDCIPDENPNLNEQHDAFDFMFKDFRRIAEDIDPIDG